MDDCIVRNLQSRYVTNDRGILENLESLNLTVLRSTALLHDNCALCAIVGGNNEYLGA